jgi:DNA-binding response OmpR family regulator
VVPSCCGAGVTGTYAEAVAVIMLVEDDFTIGSLVRSALRNDGHDVAWVRSGADANRIAARGQIDLVLLDLGLPDAEGLELGRELRRAQSGAVIVMLTARREEMDVIVGLESGADDYLTKPFGVAELLARVRAHLRRSSHAADQPLTYSCGDLTVDVAGRRCFLADHEVVLRSKEFDLLSRLVASAGEALSRHTLMSDVWGANWFGSTKTLDVHVAAVRQRLAQVSATRTPPVTPPDITTLRGFGYRLEAPKRS